MNLVKLCLIRLYIYREKTEQLQFLISIIHSWFLQRKTQLYRVNSNNFQFKLSMHQRYDDCNVFIEVNSRSYNCNFFRIHVMTDGITHSYMCKSTSDSTCKNNCDLNSKPYTIMVDELRLWMQYGHIHECNIEPVTTFEGGNK